MATQRPPDIRRPFITTMKSIAMLALAAGLAAQCFAKTVDVTFDAALTNGTEWVYSDGFTAFNEGYAFKNRDAVVTSPVFDFAITSVVVVVKKKASTSRDLKLRRIMGNGEPFDGDAEEFLLPEATEGVFTNSCAFAASNVVRGIEFFNSTGTGNLYLRSATISGVVLIEPPANVSATSVCATGFTLSWENPENAVSNRIDLCRVIRHEAEGDVLDSYDFTLLTNKTANAKPWLDGNGVMKDYPCFSGTNVYAAGTNAFGATPSVGLVQLSSSDHRGALVYSGPGVNSSATLLVMAKKDSTDVDHGTWGLAVDVMEGVVTNATVEVNIGADYPLSPLVVPLTGATPGGSIVLRPSGTADRNRRILIDSISFVSGYSPAHEEVVQLDSIFLDAPPGAASRQIRHLERNGTYMASVTAFDSSGVKSDASEVVRAELVGHDPGFSVIIK